MYAYFMFIIAIFLFWGCAKPVKMANTILDMADNQVIMGWDDGSDKNIKSEKKVIKKETKPNVTLKDSDNDGVIDSLDKCPNTPKNIEVTRYGCPIIKTMRMIFDTSKAEVKKIYYPQIERIAEIMKNNPKLKIEIAGYTDNTGDWEYNLDLSQKRADAIRDILINKYKIDPKRIVAIGYGEEYPLVPNDTPTNKALNRRVEIVNITNKKGVIKKPITSVKHINVKKRVVKTKRQPSNEKSVEKSTPLVKKTANTNTSKKAPKKATLKKVAKELNINVNAKTAIKSAPKKEAKTQAQLDKNSTKPQTPNKMTTQNDMNKTKTIEFSPVIKIRKAEDSNLTQKKKELEDMLKTMSPSR